MEPNLASAEGSQRTGQTAVAGVAALLMRYTDRTALTIGLRSDDGGPEVPVALELAGELSFAEVVGQVQTALANAGAPPRTNGAELDALVETKSATGEPRVLVRTNGSMHEPDASDPIHGHLRTLLAAATATPHAEITALPMLTEREREQLLTDWNQTRADFPQACLHELIAAQAARTPDAIAIRYDDEELTYAELDARANQLAHHLKGLGVGPEVLVGICVDRSPRMVVGLLGIHKAGGGYVPIDPAYPVDRQAFMLESSQAPVVITEQHLRDSVPAGDAKLVCIDSEWDTIARQASSAPQTASNPRQLAYVIYTSGSTGKPKGVQIEHRALINFLTTMQQTPGLKPDDVLVAVTTLSFDIAGLELYLPLITGAQVVICPATTTSDPRGLGMLLERSGATIMQATPTTWRMLVDAGWTPVGGHLKGLCGGEPLPVSLADSLLGVGVELWNMYGPTETTIWSTCCQIETHGKTLTIGRPIANTTIYVLDPKMAPVPVGVAGELWIGGDGLARGYRGRDDLTAERFVPDPFDDAPGARIYRTGDLVRYRPDGDIEFLGRIDNQVKVRGFRIELGEIETVLANHEAVGSAVVVARGEGAEAELAAYVITRGIPVSSGSLRRYLTSKLPAYMVPSTVTALAEFPLTPNGKIDRKALPEPSRERAEERELVAPRTDLERRLTTIWERELGISPIGVTDDFFDLGVTSLMAATLFAAIEHELGNALPLGAIFQASTIEALANLLGASDANSSRWTSLVPIQPTGTKPPIFCIHGGAGTILHLAPLARKLGPDQPFYGLQSRGLYGGTAPIHTVQDMATHYLKEMREVWPSGPWYLAGYCFGSLVAFELAHRLQALGEDVRMVAVFNGPSPTWIKQWGWYGNQPSIRAKLAAEAKEREATADAPPPPPPRQSFGRRLTKAVRDPKRFVTGAKWYLREPRMRIGLALGRPVPEEMRELYFFGLHARAEHAYDPAPYRGEMIIFYGMGLYEDPSLGWEGLADSLEIVGVPGNHANNRHAMMEPAVDYTAERLEAYLERVA
jgi:amino acid adenylation domain-containing protein